MSIRTLPRRRSTSRTLLESLESRLLLTVTPAPFILALQSPADSGLSPTDRITNYNNADPAHALTFAVDDPVNTDHYLYIDGVLAGFTSLSDPRSDLISTDGHTVIANGTHIISVRAQIPGEDLSDSKSISITIDTHASLLGAQDLDFELRSRAALSSLSEVTVIHPLASGKILVGSALAGSVHAVVARLNPDGSLDTSFGSQGFAVLSPQGSVSALAIQSDGSILAGLSDSTEALARLSADGQLDTSFGASGYVIDGAVRGVRSIDLLPAGKILAGFVGGVLQLNANGQPDTSFAPFGTFFDVQPGTQQLQNVVGVALSTNGQIYIAGNGSNGPTTLRLNSDGSLDTSFAAGGYLTLPPDALDPTATTMIGAIALDSAGRLLIGSYILPTRNTPGSDPLATVRRFNSEGSLDTSFGTAGAVALPTITAPITINFIIFAHDGTPLVNANGILYHLSDSGALDANYLSIGAVPLSDDGTTPSATPAILPGFLSDGSILATNGSLDASHYLTRIIADVSTIPPILLTPASDTGTLGDNITSIPSPSIAINYFNNMYSQLYEGATLIATFPADPRTAGDSVLAYTFNHLSNGTHHFTLRYYDLAGNLAPQASSFDITVNAASRPVYNITASLAASSASLPAGARLTLTATLATSASSLPTGSIIFLDNNAFIGAAALSNGHASLTVGPSLGAHHYSAVFVGAPGYTSALSNFLPVTVTANHLPAGLILTTTASGISGWAYDSDIPATAEFLRIDIDGKTAAYLTANADLSDIPFAHHGFSYAFTNHTPGAHSVQVYAFNFPSAASPAPVLIATSGFINHPATAAIQVATAHNIVGWAYDADTPDTSLLLYVQIDNNKTGIIVNALDSRTDTASLGNGNHGFHLQLPTLTPGAHRITVYVFDSDHLLDSQVSTTIHV